jgi:hypothetical protein
MPDILKSFFTWIPWIILILLAGSFNLMVAYQKLYQDCRSPFFHPWKSCGFWFWVVIQMAAPGLVFWFFAKISDKPEIKPELCFSAIGVGFFFTVLVNANADLGFVNFPIDKWYAFFNKLAYDRIAAEQTGKWTKFEQQLSDQLHANSASLEKGLVGLQRYFNRDLTFKNNEPERQARLRECDAARQAPTLDLRIEAIASLLLHIRRSDLRDRLQDFGCPQDFLDRHFPP